MTPPRSPLENGTSSGSSVDVPASTYRHGQYYREHEEVEDVDGQGGDEQEGQAQGESQQGQMQQPGQGQQGQEDMLSMLADVSAALLG